MSAQDRWDDQEIERLIQSSLNVEPSASFLSRVRAAVAETTIDQEIQETLNVEPSPEFVARIRRHVDQDQHAYVKSGRQYVESGFSRGRQYVESGFSRIFSTRWALGTAGLAAAAALVIAMLLTRSATDQPPAPIAASSTATPPEVPTPGPATAVAGATGAASPSTRQSNAVAVRVEPRSDPEVIVSRQEIRAFREYWTRLNPDAFNTTAVADHEPGAEPLPVVEQLTIEPIIVNPIDPSTE